MRYPCLRVGHIVGKRVSEHMVNLGKPWGSVRAKANISDVRLGRFVDLDLPDSVIGIEAFRHIHAEGANRHQLGIVLDWEEPPIPFSRWLTVEVGDRRGDHITNNVWSYRLQNNTGFGLIEAGFNPGDRVPVRMHDGPCQHS